jgi:copper resistance protein C
MIGNHPIVAAAIFTCAMLGVHGADAHAFLDHANPAVGSTVPSPPGAVTMWFTQQLEPAFTSAVITDQAGNNVGSGAAEIDPQDRTELRVSLKPLLPGTYTVTWHALSVDTHRTQGHFNFDVAQR